LHFAIGDNIHGLTLGVVNHEVDSISECFNPSLTTAVLDEFDCQIEKVSCRFIKSIDDETAELVRN
jgi:hypothetical protein